MDIFGILPREIEGGEHPELFSNESRLARFKMTQRDRDWPTVHELGQRLLAQNKVEGLLFLQEAQRLRTALTDIPCAQRETMIQQRPLLGKIQTSTPVITMDAWLRIEQTFWKKLDKLRLQCYRNAGKEYSLVAKKELTINQSLLEQNKLLTAKATELLPTHPLTHQS
jgi:hypothetical protein